jgi:hypothetical protein
MPEKPRLRTRATVTNLSGNGPPDLRTGKCFSHPAGREAHNNGFNDGMRRDAFAARERAKAWCKLPCPVLDKCRAWVMSEESPAGSWGGVYAGMDRWDRTGKPIRYSSNGAERAPE